MTRLFISYRREDSQHAVDRLHAALKPHFNNPEDDIFIDVDNIPFGVDFVEHLDGKVAQCDIMLVVIGKHWITAQDPQSGKPRLDDAADFVRIEIASALARGVPVVPLMLDGTELPTVDALPAELKPLATRNGVNVDRLTFETDVARLIGGLGIGVTPESKPNGSASVESNGSEGRRSPTNIGSQNSGKVTPQKGGEPSSVKGESNRAGIRGYWLILSLISMWFTYISPIVFLELTPDIARGTLLVKVSTFAVLAYSAMGCIICLGLWISSRWVLYLAAGSVPLALVAFLYLSNAPVVIRMPILLSSAVLVWLSWLAMSRGWIKTS